MRLSRKGPACCRPFRDRAVLSNDQLLTAAVLVGREQPGALARMRDVGADRCAVSRLDAGALGACCAARLPQKSRELVAAVGTRSSGERGRDAEPEDGDGGEQRVK